MATINDLIRSREIPGINKSLPGIKQTNQKNPDNVDFADTIKDFLDTVNNDQKIGGKSVQQIIMGESENLAEAMTKLEESNLSFQLMLEIRNKLVDAYKDINRMQV